MNTNNFELIKKNYCPLLILLFYNLIYLAWNPFLSGTKDGYTICNHLSEKKKENTETVYEAKRKGEYLE